MRVMVEQAACAPAEYPDQERSHDRRSSPVRVVWDSAVWLPGPGRCG